MPLKLMYITNNPDIAAIAQNSGVDRLFVDMEYINKDSRQNGMDTVKSFHTIEDIQNLRKVLNTTELLVRINPIHPATETFMGTEAEIDAVIDAGADIIMLPMAKTAKEVEFFVSYVNKRAKTLFLLETAEAVDNLDDILQVDGIDEIHIGLNDLHLAYGKKFMFQLLSDGTVEKICNKIKFHNIPYGFGGIARLGYGLLPAEYIIAEHYRLNSSMAILSRSFCDIGKITDINKIAALFTKEISKIRTYENDLTQKDDSFFIKTKETVYNLVQKIVLKIGD